jgi:hydrogenase maturation factor HypE
MSRETIKSLTRKGYSQYKIAKTLKIRKQKVASYQKTHKIGVRAAEKGAVKFWTQVAMRKESEEVTRKEAIRETKYTKYWFERRQKRLTGVEKAKDKMSEKWHRIKKGDIERSFWLKAEGEELMEAAEYD